MSTAHDERERFQQFLANHPLSTRMIDDVGWEYIVCGQGEPLLLLPGALATAETSFQYILAFEKSHRVIAPSYPAMITAVAPLVDGLAALLRAERCAPAHVLGGSYSGLVAQCLVRRHPAVVASLMLTNTGVPRPERARRSTLLLACLALLPEATLRSSFKRFIRAFLPESTPSQDFWRSYFVQLLDTFGRGDYFSRLKVAIDFDRYYRFTKDDLANWSQQIMLVEAEQDAIFTAKERIALRTLYPHARCHIQHASNHSASLDQADETISLMKTFLANRHQSSIVNCQSLVPRLALLALGSRGDVQPFIALGLRLRERGYHVRVLAIEDYAELVESYGLEFAPLVGRAADLMDRELVYQLLEGASNPVLVGYRFLQSIRPLFRQLMADCWAACQDVDGIVASTLGQHVAASLVERRPMPLVMAHFHPNSQTRFWPDKSFPALPAQIPGRELYNLLSYPLADHGLWQLLGLVLNEARRSVLDLPSLGPLALWRRTRTFKPPTLYGYSRHVAPAPPDWSRDEAITGYWFVERPVDWQPPAELVAFLAAGPPPVYIGFGSILLGRNADRVTNEIVAALRQTGQRGILFRGWGDMGNIALPPDVLLIDAVPHDWLFPQVAAVVHHGGAGTTAATLRAGVPSVVVPAFGDMTFWAARVAALGVGPAPITRANLNATTLAAALRLATSDQNMRQRAAILGQRIVAEYGAERAAVLIEQMLFQECHDKQVAKHERAI